MDFEKFLDDSYEIITGEALYKINGGNLVAGGANGGSFEQTKYGNQAYEAPKNKDTGGSTPTAPKGGEKGGNTSTTSTNNNQQGTPQNVNGMPQGNEQNNNQKQEPKGPKYDVETVFEIYNDFTQFRNLLIKKDSIHSFDTGLLYLTEVGDFAKKKAKNCYKKITKFHFEDRDKLNVITESFEEILAESLDKENGNWELMSLKKSKYHQNGYGQREYKFVCKDGREAVFSQDYHNDGKFHLVTDPRYKGTYNYCVPGFERDNFFVKGVTYTGHFFQDMVPYYFTGCKNERNQ